MDFIHADILDKDMIPKNFKDADVVHHLAGITEVPRTKSEASEEKDNKNKLVGEKFSKYIGCNKRKMQNNFPSTHVIYEGIDSVKDINEEEESKPDLSYSSSKAANEKQLKNSEKIL